MEQNGQKSEAPGGHVVRIIGVRFRNGGKRYNFNAGDLHLKVGDLVIVQSDSGLICGRVAGGQQQVSEDYLRKPLRKVLRAATEADLEVLKENRVLEQKARTFCLERIEARNMQMKLVEVEYLFDRSKVIFYFTAEGRVDFRELVKDLAAQLRTRIEMRQIGVRDEAKMLGGFGACGKELCCKTFVRDFEPVSIKMAKQQDLTLNPAKISGVCGRLMCCLSYESANYSAFKKGLPKVGKNVKTVQGQAKVVAHNVLKGSITIQSREGTRIELTEPDLARLRKGLPVEIPGEPERQPRTAPPAQADERKAPPPPPEPAKPPVPAGKGGTPRAGKPGLLDRIKKIAGGEPEEGDAAAKPKRKRRRRRRFRRKKSGTSSGGSDKDQA